MDIFQKNIDRFFHSLLAGEDLAYDGAPLPLSYNHTLFEWLPVSSLRIFLFWDFSFHSLLTSKGLLDLLAENLSVSRQQLELLLRLYRLDIKKKRYVAMPELEVSMDLSQRSLYLDYPWQEEPCLIEIGMRDRQGRFCPFIGAEFDEAVSAPIPPAPLTVMDEGEESVALQPASSQSDPVVLSLRGAGEGKRLVWAELVHGLKKKERDHIPVICNQGGQWFHQNGLLSKLTRECEQQFVAGISSRW